MPLHRRAPGDPAARRGGPRPTRPRARRRRAPRRARSGAAVARLGHARAGGQPRRVRRRLARCCSSNGSGRSSPTAPSRSRSAAGSGRRCRRPSIPHRGRDRRGRAGRRGRRPTGSRTPTPKRSGYPSRDALVADLRGDPALPVTRIQFHLVDEPDPRAVLAASDGSPRTTSAAIDARLDRLDRASRHGAWTHAVLRARSRARPRPVPRPRGVVRPRDAPTSSSTCASSRTSGLTLSLPVGYRLSARGEAYLRSP